MNKKAPIFAAFFLMVASLVRGDVVPPELIVGLAAEDFTVREKSQISLLLWAKEKPEARAILLAKLSADEDPEIRKRTYEILRALSDDDYLSDGQGYLGIMMAEEILKAAPDAKPVAGIRVSHVVKESPAAISGLKADDLIIALEGKQWMQQEALNAFMEAIAGKKPLSNVVLTIRRDAADPFDVTVKLGKRPVQDLSYLSGDLQLLDKRAKDEHFREWLKHLGAGQ